MLLSNLLVAKLLLDILKKRVQDKKKGVANSILST